MEYLQEMSDPILTKLRQLNRDDFQDLVALGTFPSYENIVYLAGPCNIGKSSLASILIGEEIPRTWVSIDGLIIHFGRNGIDLQQRKMIPLEKGSGDVLAKLLLGNPEFKKQPSLQSESRQKVPGDPKSNVTTKGNQLNPSNINLGPTNQEQMSSKSNQETPTDFPEPPIHTAHSIQDDLLEKIKKSTNIMNIAPSDLVDFGGQNSFDMTHQLFIQHRGTFILMFDGRTGLYTELEEYPQGEVTAASVLEHWINSVLTYCNNTEDNMPRFVFAATHSDSFSEDEKRKLVLQFNKELWKMFSSHKLHEHIMYDTVFFMNATDAADQDIERLKDTLVDIAFQQSTWGQKMPVIWVPLELQISDMREDGVKLITKERLLQINKSNNEFALNERRVDDFLLVQHSIGKLLYFDEPALRDFIVIQPTAMVNIMRPVITDKMFWPEKGPVRDLLENVSSTGVLKKTDLFILWSQPPFKEIFTDVRTKEYIVQVLLHLDILVKAKRYTETDTAADLFLVPCLVKEKIPQKMQRNATDDRTLCIAYHLTETVVPSALFFKLVGAAINIWPLKVEGSRICLYSQSAIMYADNRNEIQVHVEGQRIFAYLINDVSKQLISPDLATITQECLTLALTRILQFYRRCFGKQSHHLMSDLFVIEVGERCKGETCLIPLSDAKRTAQWRCKNGKIHETKCPLNWVVDKNKKHCDSSCKGLDTETLDLTPNDQHFVQLAKTIGIGDFYNFFIELGMEKADYDNLNFRYFSNPMDFMLMGLFEWRDKTESDQLTATFGKLQKALTAIERQHYLCQIFREDYSLLEKADYRLQDIPSDHVINTLTEMQLIGDCIVHLGVELGLSIYSIKETIMKNPRNVYGQIHDLLIKWKSGKVTPTIYRLMVAFKRVEASEGLAFLVKTYEVQPKNTILDKLSQLNSEDFNDLVAQGTFASYENRVYLAGPCNTGKSSLASILVDDETPKKWDSTDGLVIHFGRNGIDLERRKMIPLKGSGDIVTKVILGNPEVKERENVINDFHQTQKTDQNDDKVKEVPLSYQVENRTEPSMPKKVFQLPTKQQQQERNFISSQIPSDGEQQMQPTTIPGTPKHKQELKPTIQEYILGKMKKRSYTMNTAPSDLIDFGGQKSFDMTHQLFIQHRGTFILMFDGRLGLYKELREYPQDNVTTAAILKHWITSILTYCNKSEDEMPRILFAATHSDSFKNERDKRNKTKEFEKELKDLFSTHKLCKHIVYDKVFFINATDAADRNIESLKDTLVDIAYGQSTWGQQMPIVWMPLDLLISDMREDGVALITKKKLLAINRSNNEFAMNDRRVEDFLLVQHSIGKLLYFDEPALKDFIVIQPTTMVNILRAFITDRTFWPNEAPFRDILENLSSTGMLKKADLFILWSQQAFKDIFKDIETKDYVVQVLLHLDILVKPNRYIEKDIDDDLFFVPCIVKENMPEEIQKRTTDDKTMVLAYNLNTTVVPSALSFKLIGAAINMWPLIVSDKRRCLYFQSAVMDVGDKNKLQICVEGQRIIIYLINEVSKQSISSDLATRTQECLTLALERILDFYCRSIGEKSHRDMSKLFEIEVGEVCKGTVCLIRWSEANGQPEWKCKNGITHKTEHPKNWAFAQSQAHCDANCKGFTPKPGQTAEIHHLVKLARTINLNDFKTFLRSLDMTDSEYNDLNSCYGSNPMGMRLMGLYKWKNRIKSNRQTATIEHLLPALKCIEGQHYLCQIHEEDHTLSGYQYRQDVPSNDVIEDLTKRRLIGNCVVQLGFELGLSYGYIQEILDNFKNDLNRQICELLKSWLNNELMNTVKPTIYALMVALKHVEAADGLHYLIQTCDMKPDNKLNVKQKGDYKSTIKDKYDFIVQQKLDISGILDQMMTRLVISVDDRRNIEHGKMQDGQTKALLDIVIERGGTTNNVFIDVLQECGYNELADNLIKVSVNDSLSSKADLEKVQDYKIRLQKNYLEIINRLKHNDQ